MDEHLNFLLSQECLRIGISHKELTEWQTRMEKETPIQWLVTLKEIKERYDKFDEEKRVANYLRISKISMLMQRQRPEFEMPEEIIEGISNATADKGEYCILTSEAKMPYLDLTLALEKLFEFRINSRVLSSEPHKFKLPFVITASDEIRGSVSSQSATTKKMIPLITVWGNEEEIRYQFFGQAVPKFQRKGKLLIQHSQPFYLYKMQVEDGTEVFLLSIEELLLEPCKIVGMPVRSNDMIKIGELARISSSTLCYFVHTQYPDVEPINDNRFREVTAGWTQESLSAKIFGKFRHPPWFEKLMLAWLFSAKFSGYPLHLALLSPAGAGKTIMMESLSRIFMEDIASGSTYTMKGLIPSFGNGTQKEGYLAQCKRIGLIDEFFAMVKRSSSYGNRDDADTGTFNMLELLEHKEREVKSGFGSIRVKPRMKVLLASNAEAYANLRNLVEISQTLNFAFVSRLMWYNIPKDHVDFILEKKIECGALESEIDGGQYDKEFIAIYNFLQTKRVTISGGRIRKVLEENKGYIPTELYDRVYAPRMDHHLACLIDGYAKVNSILEGRENIELTETDYAEAEASFIKIVRSWLSDLNMGKMQPRQRIAYLSPKLKMLYELIEKNPGIRTAAIKFQHSDLYDLERTLNKLRAFGLIDFVLDLDGTTKMWNAYWQRA